MKSDEISTPIRSLEEGNVLQPAGIRQRRGHRSDSNHVILCLKEHLLRRFEKGPMKLSFIVCFNDFSALRYRHSNWNLEAVHTTTAEFENATLFAQLGRPSTLLTNPSRKRSYTKPFFKPEEFLQTGGISVPTGGISVPTGGISSNRRDFFQPEGFLPTGGI